MLENELIISQNKFKEIKRHEDELQITIVAGEIAGAMFCSNASAQDNEFDLSSQRGEKQDVVTIPGKKVDHQGLIINPTPHNLVKAEGSLDVRRGYRLVDKKKRFSLQQAQLAAEGIKFAADGVKLVVDFDAQKAVKNGVKATSGAYTMSIGNKCCCY